MFKVIIICVLVFIFKFHCNSCWTPFFGQKLHKHSNLQSHHREWDFLEDVDLNDTEHLPEQISQAIFFNERLPADKIILEPDTTNKIVSQLQDEISFYFVFKQHAKSVGSLLSIQSPIEVKPFLQIMSNLETMQLELIYHILEDGKAHYTSFQLPKKMSHTWTRLLITINKTQAKLWINCDHYRKETLAGNIDLKFPESSLIYFRHLPNFKQQLLGNIQVGKILNYSVDDRLWICEYDAQFTESWRPPMLG